MSSRARIRGGRRWLHFLSGLVLWTAPQGGFELERIHDGAGVAGVFLLENRVEILGVTNRLAAWDVRQARLLAEDELEPFTPPKPGESLLFSHADVPPAHARWGEAARRFSGKVEIEPGTQSGKRVTLPAEYGLILVLSGDRTTLAAFRRDVHRPGDGTVHVADLERGRLRQDVVSGAIDDVLVSDRGGRVLVLQPGRTLLFGPDGEELASWPPAQRAWLAPGGELAALHRGVRLEIHSVDALEAQWRVGAFVRDVALAPGARRVAVATDERVLLHELGAAEPIWSQPSGRRGGFRSVDLDATGAHLVAGALRARRPRTRSAPGDGVATILYREEGSEVVDAATFPVAEWSRGTPDARFLGVGGLVVVTLPDGVWLVRQTAR